MKFILHCIKNDPIIQEFDRRGATPELVNSVPPFGHCTDLPGVQILEVYYKDGLYNGIDEVNEFLKIYFPEKRKRTRARSVPEPVIIETPGSVVVPVPEPVVVAETLEPSVVPVPEPVVVAETLEPVPEDDPLNTETPLPRQRRPRTKRMSRVPSVKK